METLFRNTLSPGQWALLAAIPPAIIALYFLKLRRQPIEVPSTYLWSKSIEDLRVNSLWQRMRKSLLLFLQLLIVGLAILALLRPGWQGTELTSGRLIFLIDNSASMSTTDARKEGDAGKEGGAREDGDASRISIAKEKVAGLIDQMDRGMTAMIVSFADTPRVVQEFTDNQRLLRERLDTIKPTIGTTDLGGALKLADGLANPAQVTVQEGAPEVDVVLPESATLFVLSDGRFDDVKDFALGNLEPIYVPLGSPQTNNLAITALETRRNEKIPNQRQAFVQVTNFGPQAAEAIIELRLNGDLLDAQKINVPAGFDPQAGKKITDLGGKAAGLTIPLGEVGAGELEARISESTLTELGDRLSIDNLAYAALNDSKSGRILLVTPGNIAIEQAVATARTDRLGGVEVVTPPTLKTKTHLRDAAAGGFDLIIYDRCVPEEMPRANTLFIGQLPPIPNWQANEDAKVPSEEEGANLLQTVVAPSIIDWNRAHPLLAHIELGNFDIVETLVVDPPAGGTALIDAAEGAIAAIAPRDGYEDAVLGFAILVEEDGRLQRNTDWINRHSFPTFWLNALEYFVNDSAGGARSYRPGKAVELRPLVATTDKIDVISPDGVTTTLRRRGSEPFVYQSTETTGIYQVQEAGSVIERFAVNLFDRRESDVRLRRGNAEDSINTASADGSDSAKDSNQEVASLQIGNIQVNATAGAAPARKELWRYLLLAALAILVVEWYVYHRRVYV